MLDVKCKINTKLHQQSIYSVLAKLNVLEWAI